jgi:hypothetical protein
MSKSSQSYITTDSQWPVCLDDRPIWDQRPIFSPSLIIFRQFYPYGVHPVAWRIREKFFYKYTRIAVTIATPIKTDSCDSWYICRRVSHVFLDSCGVCWCGAPSLTRSRVCSFQFLLGIASAVFFRSEAHGTHELTMLKKLKFKVTYDRQSAGKSVLGSSSHLGPMARFLFSVWQWGFLAVCALPDERNSVAQLYPLALGSFFIASYDSQSYGGGIQVYCDRLSVGQFVVVSSPLWGPWPDSHFLYLTITFFLFHVGRPQK